MHKGAERGAGSKLCEERACDRVLTLLFNQGGLSCQRWIKVSLRQKEHSQEPSSISGKHMFCAIWRLMLVFKARSSSELMMLA